VAGPKVQDYPAEGSREVVERELARLADEREEGVDAANAADVTRLLGELDAAQMSEILALAPTLAELEQASAWLRGEGDQPAREGHPLAGKAAAIFDIAAQEEDIEPQ
jgi:hypothetical protein